METKEFLKTLEGRLSGMFEKRGGGDAVPPKNPPRHNLHESVVDFVRKEAAKHPELAKLEELLTESLRSL